MKTFKVSGQVPDVSGLYFDLLKAEFEVSSISHDGESATIHLEDVEDKDPLPIAEMWIDRPLEKPSRSIQESRRKLYQTHLEERSARISAARARISAQSEIPFSDDEGFVSEYADQEVQVLALEPKKSEGGVMSFLAEKLKKIW